MSICKILSKNKVFYSIPSSMLVILFLLFKNMAKNVQTRDHFKLLFWYKNITFCSNTLRFVSAADPYTNQLYSPLVYVCLHLF